MSLTDAQRTCVESLDGQLVVSAGAGTGKTYTLSQKIGWMMQQGIIDSIDQVLAITFTRKAAGEIKARVRSTLRQRGMHQQALLVDGAWIGTIHGMCSRILRENALEFGIDPAFEVIEDNVSQTLLEQALEQALSPNSELSDSQEFASLFANFKARAGTGYGATSVEGIVSQLINAASASPEGFESIETGPQAADPGSIIGELRQVIADSLAFYQNSTCSSKTFLAGLDTRRQLLDNLDRVLSDGHRQVEFDTACQALDAVDKKPGKLTAKAYPQEEERFLCDMQAYDKACRALWAWQGKRNLQQAMQLAQRVKEAYDLQKRQLGVLDQDDLLVQTCLCLRRNPQVAQRYQQQFKLLMVDEFQDTSYLQVQIVEMLRGPQAQLCTVGDAQQSIYRFRNADVNVYEQFVEQSNVQPVELDLNFRSHGDILRFSNRVFEQPHVFGKRFLELVPGRPSQEESFHDMPRASIVSVQHEYHKASSEDTRAYEAAAIAQLFAEYRDKGCKPGDMVLLLGGMTNAHVYSQALAARGFDVMIAGGSGFWQSAECAMICSLLSVLADQHDTQALYDLLTCGVVPIGADDLLWLVWAGQGQRRRIDRGFAAINDEASCQLQLMRHLVDVAATNMAVTPLCQVVEQFFSDSGYFERMASRGAEGSASCANILKAVRFIDDFETHGKMGVSQVAEQFARMVQTGGKEGPGVLMADVDDAVRIMTIHASKGLEFPIVAIVEFTRQPTARAFVLQSYAGRNYAMLGPGKAFDRYEMVKKSSTSDKKDSGGITANDLVSAADQGSYVDTLGKFYLKEELAEAKRKFYVGVTRAEEAVCVAVPVQLTKKGLAPQSIAWDVAQAFFHDEVLPEQSCSFQTGGVQQGEFRCIRIAADQNGVVRWMGHDDYELPVPLPPTAQSSVPNAVPRSPLSVLRQMVARDSGMFSYSSISPHGNLDTDELPMFAPQRIDDETDDQSGKLLASDEDDATQLGLAFHAVGEYMALAGYLGGFDRDEQGKPAVTHPGAQKVDAIANSFGVSTTQHRRLHRSVDAWVGSDVAKHAASYPNIQAEVPFCMEFPSQRADGSPHFINGEIDLLCTTADGGQAFIVDYKTGGFADETPQQLVEKHRLQSLCYAYAVLTAGVRSVRLVFTRVEMLQADGQPQTVEYEYGADRLSEIRDAIAQALQRSEQQEQRS